MKTAWRFFPWAVAGAIGLVVAVNAVMISAAIRTSPGKAGEGFSLSNHYDAVLAQSEREVALGWSVAVRADAAGRPTVTLADREGAPLRGAAVAGIAQRPLGASETRPLVFNENGDGRYVADTVLPLPGQWELTLSAAAAGRTVAATRRVIVR